MQKSRIYEETEQEIDLNKLDQRHQSEVFKDKIFSGKDIVGIKFNNISFIKCNFDGAKISNCQFNHCVFSGCSFKETTLSNCHFDDKTFVEKCIFDGTKITDVEMRSSLSENNFTQDCKVKNFIYGNGPVDDVSQITSVVECIEESVEEQPVEEKPVEEEISAEELGELESRQNPDVDFRLYNALFPEILKLYPALQKDEYGYELTIDNIDFSISPDKDSSAWRYVFMVRDTDDSLGSDVVTVGTDKEITFETLKEAFETTIKGEIKSIADRTDSQVIKNSLQNFAQNVFKDCSVITEEMISNNLLVDIFDSPEDITGFFTPGYDMVNQKTCIIVGKPFSTNNTAQGDEVREIIKAYQLIINEDINTLTDEELYNLSKDQPFTCFVYQPSVLYQKVNARRFSRDQIVIIK